MGARTFDTSRLPRAVTDKSVPGAMMSRLRLKMPALPPYAGSTLLGKLEGRDVTVLDVFEAIGQHSAGNMCEKNLGALEVNPQQSGALRMHADQAGRARKGAVTHGGAKAEVVCYAGM